jgi:arginine exporter protein ArgO
MFDSTLTWKRHKEMIITKLSVACLVVTAIKPYVVLDTLNMVSDTQYIFSPLHLVFKNEK